MNTPTPDTDAAWKEGNAIRKWTCRKLERERNEARTTIEDAKRALNATDYEGILLAAMRVKEELADAREAIPAGEWVAYEDHKKVHDAASRLLTAINKQLPIGCFTLISSKYYTLKNAIYGREDAK